MKRLPLALLVFLFAGSFAAAEPLVVELWPGLETPSGLPPEKTTDRGTDAKHDRSVTAVTQPTITVMLPASDKPTAAVVICPGGGYGGLAIDKEGFDVARWLNSVGVAGIVLKYRMPHPDLTGDKTPWPLEDAWRAIRLVRSRAAEWKIDPNRVGIMGFSAGGHLASTAGTHFEPARPDAADPLERFSTRPDFMTLVYPVVTLRDPVAHKGSRANLLGKEPSEKMLALYSNDEQVTAQTPPTFLTHAKDDGVKVENSLKFAEALKAAGVPCEVVLFEKGGHGFGLGVKGGEPATWPGKWVQWLDSIKMR